MDKDNLYFAVGGLAAGLFYLGLILLLILFFNDYHHAKRYVPKKSHTIEVSIMSAPPVKRTRAPRKPEPKKEAHKTPVKSVSKKAPAPSPKKAAPPKKPVAIASLFEKVKVAEPTDSRPARLANAPKIRYKAPTKSEKRESRRAEALVRDLNLSRPDIKMASSAGGEGEVDAYMSKLYEILYGTWQPEALYAGESASVRLDIAPDGSFTYRVVRPSDNQGFNQSLIEYLDTLQRKGLPPHKRGQPLRIDVEFKAKE